MKAISILFCFLLCVASAAAGKAPVNVWPVDPLIKVFRDAQPARASKAVEEAARGEYATFQVVVKSRGALSGLRAAVTHFTHGSDVIEARAPRFVGYVPVDRPTQKPSKDQLRTPPADYPDPLLEVASLDVAAGQAQPVWVTVKVPETINPGTYKATLTLDAKAGDNDWSTKQVLVLKVYPATITKTRLWVTDWFGINSSHMKINPEKDSDEYYALMRRFARNMAEHRHNVAIISAMGHADFGVDPAGGLTVDFSEFDKWVNIFIEEGVIGRIEGGHIGWRSGGWTSPFVVEIHQVKDGKAVSSQVDPSSPEADAFYKWYFPKLVEHLRAKGWLDQYLQHLADEPISVNVQSYAAMAQLLRKYAPELKIIEACHSKDLVGSMDVWVPQLNYLHNDFPHYQARQKAGEEVWFYNCVYPQGEYANRFIELPLIKTRLLHWINYRYGITGYLHWGYNQWTPDDPFTHTTRPHNGPPYLPAGDPWVVYPGDNGPLDSIRFEAMRDGIDDHELLSQIGDVDPQKAMAFAQRLILDFDKYDTDIKRFRATRQQLLQESSKIAHRQQS